MAIVTVCSDFRAQRYKICHCFHFFLPPICHEMMRPDAMILVYWMLNFKPAFSPSSFTLIKRLFSSSALPAIRRVSSAYLRLLIILPVILIPAYDSSSPAFHMTYSAYELISKATIYSLAILLSQFWPFCVYLMPCFLSVCGFCWQFCHSKWHPSTVLKSHLVFLSIRKLWLLTERTCVTLSNLRYKLWGQCSWINNIY